MITARRIAVLGFAIVIVGLSLFPYVVMAATSLKPEAELLSTPLRILPRDVQWSNYVEVWSAAPIATFMANSALVTVAATVLVLAVATPAAYYVARHRFRGRRAFLLFVLVTQMIAPTAVVIGLYRQFLTVGLIDSYVSLILADAAFNCAFAVWILSGFFASIPGEIQEAAQIDGCSKFQVLRRIMLPLAAPGLVTAAIFTFVAVWNEYVVALTLISSRDKQPLSVGITSFVGQYEVEYQYLFAASTLAIVPVVIMFALIEKNLVGGLTAGGVK